MSDMRKGLPGWCGIAAAFLLMLAPVAYAADDDKDTPPAAESGSGAPSDAKAPDPSEAAGDTGKDASDTGDEDKDAADKDNKSDDGKEQAGGPGDNDDRKGSVRLKDLVTEGFLIRTTVFVPAEAVTRQTGSVSADAMVLTLQKETAIAICYYTFKAYVKGGKSLMKIPSCTVFDR